MNLFEKRIKQLQRKQNIVNLLYFLLLAVTVFLLIWNIFAAIFLGYGQNLAVMFLFSLSLKIFLALTILYLALKASRSLFSSKQAATYLDQYNQDEYDTYLNALELASQPDIDKDIWQRIAQKADTKAEKQEVKTNNQQLKQILMPATAIIIISVAAFLIFPSGYQKAWNFFQLQKIPEKQHKQFVELIPGDIQLTRNEDLEIKVIKPENTQHQLFLRYHEKWRNYQMPEFSYKLNNVERSFDYFVKTPYAISDTFRVEVFELPMIKELKIKYEYPSYTNLPDSYETTAHGRIEALANSQVKIEIKSNNPLKSAEAIFSFGKVLPMQRLGKQSFSCEFELTESGSYHINLVDILGNKSRPIERQIKVVADEYPEIEITKPGQDTLLTQNMLLPLRILASDDFGLQNLQLIYQINSELADTVQIQNTIRNRDISIDHVFDLKEQYLIPGDRVTYWATVQDNSPRHKQSTSEAYVAKFPSIEQIYREIETEERQKQESLNKVLQESEKLNREMETKRLDIMKKEDYDWQDKKDLQQILQKQEALNSKIEKIAQDYKKLTEKFEQNNALSQETLDKMRKIQEIMEEIANEDLKKAMEKMQEAMQKMDPESMKKAMEDFKFSMEDFSKKLEQTLNLLENIKKEQALQKALEISEEASKMQKELNNKTANNELSPSQQAKQQQEIAKKMEKLQNQLATTDSMLTTPTDDEIKKMMEELKKQMQSDSLAQKMQEMSQSLQQNKPPMQQMQQAQQKMQAYSQQLGKMKNSMSSGMMNMNIDAVQDAITNLIFISHLHERSAAKFSQDPFAILPAQIANFESINRTLQELYQTPMIILVLGAKFIYDANLTQTAYREMFAYINDAQKSRVDSYLEDIQKGLNTMIYDLMMARDNMNSSGGGGGMQQLMQAMQQMGEQQMAMNMLTQQLLQQLGQEGRISNETRQQMQRLARDEKRLAENLKRVLQNNPEAQKQTNSLNKIIEDLEEVSRRLQYNRLDKSVVEKQERILSRLLDAQKSIHKRDYSKKRQGKQSEVEGWELPEDVQLQFEKLKQKALLQENYENYPLQYQKIIREYLKRLNEAE
ncbi:MAG TPA: hypothetical protein DHM37_08240 [Candidatus Cloacimonas sp.]|nr:hypothetical protein [Candidatus Cloacimonas sp.]